jgi:hypothetical protein
MRRHIIPRLYFAEPLLLSSLWLVALWWLTGGLGGPDAGRSGLLWWLSLAGLGLRVGSDWLLVRVVRGHALPLRACALPILKDFISLGTWAVAAFRTTVEWRGTVLQIGPGSVLTPLEAPIDIPATAAR